MNQSERSGRFISSSVAGEPCRAFLPNPLPPIPPLGLGPDHMALMEKANWALGRLDGLASLLPNTALFVYFYVRKEALLSSQIEGTQSSLSDLLLFESDEVPGVPLDDVVDVSNYIAAMNHGLARLQEGFPISLRLINEIHAVLLAKGRGSDKTPGEFRRSQNWVGGTRPGNALFVPPPVRMVMECMGALEKYLHQEDVPTLIKAALAHVQFETIHPFLDGNGRLGRLLITFLFCASGVLKEPLLYLSLYFKTHRDAYYELLQRVRTEGVWEEWVSFFLQGVLETSEQAVVAVRSILTLFEADRAKIETLGRTANSVLRVHQALQKSPILTITSAEKNTGLSYPTASTALKHLQKLGVVRETTGRERNRLFVYDAYLRILGEGTEPLKRNS